jgi:predicted  nucleic acid-binding Zn-ribbon protein
MEEHRKDEGPALSVYENVRCLECGTVYTKPTRGGTARANPGCPECGYVGWVATSVPVTTTGEPRRSDEDPQLDRSAQSR